MVYQRNTGASRPEGDAKCINKYGNKKPVTKSPSKNSFSRTDGCRNFDKSETKEDTSIPTQTWLFIKAMEYLFSAEGNYAWADIAASENFQNVNINKDDSKLQAENNENMVNVISTWEYESEIPVETISSDVNTIVSMSHS